MSRVQASSALLVALVVACAAAVGVAWTAPPGLGALTWLLEALLAAAVACAASFCYLAAPRPGGDGRGASARYPVDVVVAGAGLFVALWAVLEAVGTQQDPAMLAQRAAVLPGLLVTGVLAARLPARRWWNDPSSPGRLRAWLARAPRVDVVTVAITAGVIPWTRLASLGLGVQLGPFIGWLALVLARSITVAVRSQRQARSIERLAATDPVTGACSEWGLLRALSARLARPGAGVGLVLVTLDQLPTVARVLGHDALRGVQREVVARLGRHPQGHEVARLPADRFAVVVDAADEEDLAKHARELQRLVVGAGPLSAALSVPLRASVRAARAGTTTIDGAELLAQAWTAGVTGGGATRAADAPLDETTVLLLRDLPRALAEGQLEVLHEPVVHIPSGQVWATFARPSWRHPRLGTVGAQAFTSPLDELSLSWPVTQLVLERALGDCARWRASGLNLGVVVLLTGSDLVVPGMAGLVLEAVHRHGLPPFALVVRLHGTDAVVDDGPAYREVLALSEAGVGLSIEGFGTGRSSLADLRRLPLQRLSIDPRLVEQVGRSAQGLLVVAQTVALAHSLGLQVTAGGVADADTLQLLAGIGCDGAQGPFVAEATTAEALTGLLRARARAIVGDPRTAGPPEED